VVDVIYHIEGIVTDLINLHGSAYLTTYGFKKPHTLRIYRIKREDLEPEEIYCSESNGFVLKLSPFKNVFYVTLLPGKTAAIKPEMKKIDLSGKVTADFNSFNNGDVLVFCRGS